MATLIFLGGILFVTSAAATARYLAQKGINKGIFARIEGIE